MPRTADFERLLKGAIGLDPASIGRQVLDRALHERASVRGCRRLEDYWECVRASEAELQELIDAVVVLETWFFRHETSFAGLARLAQEEWLPRTGGDVIRLLSLPCASGEEPYSMAMSLLDAGMRADRFCIDAVDISVRALAQARLGVYRANAFRGVRADIRDRYFTKTVDGHRVNEAVRRQVQFHHGNLLAAEAFLGAGVYDVVFCRNVLIYFDSATQHALMPALSRVLSRNGALFVAPAETGLPSNHGFVPADLAMSFAFRKAETARPPRATASPARIRLAAGRTPGPRHVPAHKSTPQPPAIAAERDAHDQSHVDAVSGLARAMRLADEGHLADAARCCESEIDTHGPSAEAFYLLGIVRDAGGNQTAAAECYRKALYLDPNHSDAQIHLAFLMERLGRHGSARALRDRARRIDRKRQTPHG